MIKQETDFTMGRKMLKPAEFNLSEKINEIAFNYDDNNFTLNIRVEDVKEFIKRQIDRIDNTSKMDSLERIEAIRQGLIDDAGKELTK